MSNGNGPLYSRNWFEVSQNRVNIKWFKYDKGGALGRWYGNRDNYDNWENDGEEIKNNPKAAVRNSDYFFRPHFSWTLVASGAFSVRMFEEGFILDTASNCVYFKQDNLNYYLLGFIAVR